MKEGNNSQNGSLMQKCGQKLPFFTRPPSFHSNVSARECAQLRRPQTPYKLAFQYWACTASLNIFPGGFVYFVVKIRISMGLFESSLYVYGGGESVALTC